MDGEEGYSLKEWEYLDFMTPWYNWICLVLTITFSNSIFWNIVYEKSCSFTIFLVPWSNEPYIHWINTLFYTGQNYIWWNVCCHARLSAEVVARVQQGSHLRPDTTGLDVAESVARCLHSCWDEDPENRPDFRFVRVKLKEMQAGL